MQECTSLHLLSCDFYLPTYMFNIEAQVDAKFINFKTMKSHQKCQKFVQELVNRPQKIQFYQMLIQFRIFQISIIHFRIRGVKNNHTTALAYLRAGMHFLHKNRRIESIANSKKNYITSIKRQKCVSIANRSLHLGVTDHSNTNKNNLLFSITSCYYIMLVV